MIEGCIGTVDESGNSIVSPKSGKLCGKTALYCNDCVNAIMKAKDDKIKKLEAELEKFKNGG
jgi:hypothetical protein